MSNVSVGVLRCEISDVIKVDLWNDLPRTSSFILELVLYCLLKASIAADSLSTAALLRARFFDRVDADA